MIRSWRLAAVPLVVGLLAGCEPGLDPTSDPSSPVAPAVPNFTQVQDDSGHSYTLVEGQLPPGLEDQSVSKVIGSDGGILSLAGHTLTVPSGAVSTPTVFVMTLLANGYVEVELQALVADPMGGMLDVGEQGFDRPVTLSLSYKWGTNITDPSRLQILHLRDDGLAEPLPSTVSTSDRTVTAQLEHFSRYCMAIP